MSALITLSASESVSESKVLISSLSESAPEFLMKVFDYKIWFFTSPCPRISAKDSWLKNLSSDIGSISLWSLENYPCSGLCSRKQLTHYLWSVMLWLTLNYVLEHVRCLMKISTIAQKTRFFIKKIVMLKYGPIWRTIDPCFPISKFGPIWRSMDPCI